MNPHAPPCPVPLSFLPITALMGSLVSLCIGSTYAKTLFPVLGAEGVSALRIGLAMAMLMLAFRPWRRRWHASDARFHGCNLAGALMVLLSLIDHWNLPVFILELCWGAISIYGLLRHKGGAHGPHL